MKKFDIPPILAYIILLAVLTILAFGTPKLTFILGTIYQYAIWIFFAFAAVVIVAHSILEGKK